MSRSSPVKQALAEIRELRRRLHLAEASGREPVAVIGMGCRFPGGIRNPGQFWTALLEGRDGIQEVPADRWDAAALYDPNPETPGKMATRWGGFIDDVADFDPLFFGISPREAMAMDPQQRLLLEVAWESLEDAGIAPDRLAGTPTGVFTGIGGVDFTHLALSRPAGEHDSFLAQGVAHASASGRIAYVLGLQGPAVSVDTACSSSLVAVHLGVQSLRSGESGLVLAGGVSTILTPHMTMGLSRAGMMAADGRCKSFDARADGFVRSEGCGVVVLKRLSDAIEDGDDIRAVILGSACNQDGRSNGMTAPSRIAQEAVIRAALANAGVDGRLVGYVEAHGTGTALGDPIEAQALGAVLSPGRQGGEDHLRLGSVKTNLGHMEAAAGVGGLMKAALSLRSGMIPPSLHFRTPSPHIPWAELGIRVPVEAAPFPELEGRRLAGVSAFGFTGTNVHLVLEAPGDDNRPAGHDGHVGDHRRPSILKLTARSSGAFGELGRRYAELLGREETDFPEVCAATALGRADLALRMAVVASDAAEARQALDAHAGGEEPAGVFVGERSDPAAPEAVFLFSGYGAQRVDMGRGLYESEPVFREAVEQCEAELLGVLEVPLTTVLYPEEGSDRASAERLMERMACGQPALFALQYGLSRLWRSWGIRPVAVLGHSVGEYAAACVAGVMSVGDAVRVVAERGRLFDSLSEAGATGGAIRGSMGALLTDHDRVRDLLAPHGDAVEVAAWNGPTEVVISGNERHVEEILVQAEREGVEVRRLGVGQAAHSHLLEPILDPFERFVASIELKEPAIDLVSCILGRSLRGDEARDPAYWRRHLREPVRFSDALEALHRDGYARFIELGPHAVLSGMGARVLPDADALWLASLRRGTEDRRQILEALSAWYVGGGEVDWRGVMSRGRSVALPTYPWQHRSFWPEGMRAPDPGQGADREAVWDAVVAQARRQQEQAPLDLEPKAIPGVWATLDRLTTAIISDTLRRMEAFPDAGEGHSLDEILSRLGVVPQYRGIVARWLDRLVREGTLERVERAGQADGAFRARAALPELDRSGWEAAERIPAGATFLVEYLQRCHANLPELLTGRAGPLETLFPDGDTTTADLLYRDWSLVRYFNNLIAAVAEAAARGNAARGRRLRVLEVGAGTGGTTSAVLPVVAPFAEVYGFTDVSDLFLDRASRQFGSYDVVRYGLLDLDTDPGEAGYAAASWDLVIAANVLHAASDLPLSLGRLRSLVAPGGILAAFEVTDYLSWFDVSTALLEGWEGHEDGVRGDHPLLGAPAWEAQLRAAGFERVHTFPEPDSAASAFGLHVVLAGAEGAASPGAYQRSEHGERGEPLGGGPEPRPARGSDAPPEADRPGWSHRIRAATGREQERLVAEFVRMQIRRLLRLDASDPIDRRGRLMDLGLDSLMAVELRSRLGRGLDLDEPLPATLVFDYPTVDAIVGLLTGLLGEGEPGDVPEPTERPEPRPIPRTEPRTAPDDLSDDEVEAELLKRLDSIERSGS